MSLNQLNPMMSNLLAVQSTGESAAVLIPMKPNAKCIAWLQEKKRLTRTSATAMQNAKDAQIHGVGISLNNPEKLVIFTEKPVPAKMPNLSSEAYVTLQLLVQAWCTVCYALFRVQLDKNVRIDSRVRELTDKEVEGIVTKAIARYKSVISVAPLSAKSALTLLLKNLNGIPMYSGSYLLGAKWNADKTAVTLKMMYPLATVASFTPYAASIAHPANVQKWMKLGHTMYLYGLNYTGAATDKLLSIYSAYLGNENGDIDLQMEAKLRYLAAACIYAKCHEDENTPFTEEKVKRELDVLTTYNDEHVRTSAIVTNKDCDIVYHDMEFEYCPVVCRDENTGEVKRMWISSTCSGFLPYAGYGVYNGNESSARKVVSVMNGAITLTVGECYPAAATLVRKGENLLFTNMNNKEAQDTLQRAIEKNTTLSWTKVKDEGADFFIDYDEEDKEEGYVARVLKNKGITEEEFAEDVEDSFTLSYDVATAMVEHAIESKDICVGGAFCFDVTLQVSNRYADDKLTPDAVREFQNLAPRISELLHLAALKPNSR